MGFEKHFAVHYNFKKADESLIRNEIDSLIEYFTPERPKETMPTISAAKLKLHPTRQEEISAAYSNKDLEEELLGSISQMKAYASSFSTHLGEDAKQIDRLGKVQGSNKHSGEDNLGKLIDFQKLSQNLGFFQLMKMGVISLVLFAITMVFIMIDSFIF